MRVILGCSVSIQVSPNVDFKDILNTKNIYFFISNAKFCWLMSRKNCSVKRLKICFRKCRNSDAIREHWLDFISSCKKSQHSILFTVLPKKKKPNTRLKSGVLLFSVLHLWSHLASLRGVVVVVGSLLCWTSSHTQQWVHNVLTHPTAVVFQLIVPKANQRQT